MLGMAQATRCETHSYCLAPVKRQHIAASQPCFPFTADIHWGSASSLRCLQRMGMTASNTDAFRFPIPAMGLVALWLALFLNLGLTSQAAGQTLAEPGKVMVGTYINRIHDINYKENKVSLDLFIWFRWEPIGVLSDFNPLKSVEIVNGYFESDGKTSVVEKKIVGMSYASVRLRATIFHNWGLATFPFDRHSVVVHLEDSALDSRVLQFKPEDSTNSGISDELVLPGWTLKPIAAKIEPRVYKTNFGDDTRGADPRSEYSRLSFGIDIERKGLGTPIKVLTTVIVATLVAFVAFAIRPTDVDPRFGLGIGALFAVTASSYIVASIAPDSDVLTIADQIHIAAIWFIFASLIQSVFALKWDEGGNHVQWKRLDMWCMISFPPLFLTAIGLIVVTALWQ
jgi:hypothetical protein